MTYNLYVSGSATGQTTLSVTFGGFNESVTTRTMTLSGPGSISGSTSIPLPANSSASNTVSVSGLSAGQTYRYTVSCNGESAFVDLTTQSPPPPPDTSGRMNVYNGSSWVKGITYVFNGTSWVQGTVYVYNGSTWVKSV